MELGGKGVLLAGTGQELGEAKARENAGRCASDLLVTYSGGAVDPVAQSIRGGAGASLTNATLSVETAPLNAAVDHCCRSFGHTDINARNAGIFEPIDRSAGSIPVAWGRTVDVTGLRVRLGNHAVRQVPSEQPAQTCMVVERGAATDLEDFGPKLSRDGTSQMLSVSEGNRCNRPANPESGADCETVASGKRVAITSSGTSHDRHADQSARNSPDPAIRAFVGVCSKVVAGCAGGDGSVGRPG